MGSFKPFEKMHEIKNIGTKAGTIIYINGNSSSSLIFLRIIKSGKIEHTQIAPRLKRLKGLVIFGAPPVTKPINFLDAFLQCEALNYFLTENPEVEEIKVATETAVFDNTFAEFLINDFKNTDPKVRLALAKDLMDNNWSDRKKFLYLWLFLSLFLGEVMIPQ